jgi:hypothetical protein
MMVEEKNRPVEELEPQPDQEDQIGGIAGVNQFKAELAVNAAGQLPL